MKKRQDIIIFITAAYKFIKSKTPIHLTMFYLYINIRNIYKILVYETHVMHVTINRMCMRIEISIPIPKHFFKCIVVYFLLCIQCKELGKEQVQKKK